MTEEQLWRAIQAHVGASVDGDPGPETARKVFDKFGLKSAPAVPKSDIVKGTGKGINRIILHCSATPEGRDVSSGTIAGWHRARGFSNRGGTYVGYHFLIHINGRIEACKPEDVRGTHAAPWNTGSIGVCYIGGLDAETRAPKDTRTPAQIESMKRLVRDLVAAYRGSEVLGHRDVPGVAKACPCFDARSWWASVKGRP